MRDRKSRYVLKMSSLCSLVCIASCEPGSASLEPQGLSTITVLVKDNMAYPIHQFTCSDEEGPGSNESCPGGFACDTLHYHGNARAIGMLAANGAADVRSDNFAFTVDPDPCH